MAGRRAGRAADARGDPAARPAARSALLPEPDVASCPESGKSVDPEPTEQARYLIALAGPLLLALATLLLVRRAPARLAGSGARLAAGVELVAVLVLAGCFVAQRLQLPQAGPHGAAASSTSPIPS